MNMLCGPCDHCVTAANAGATFTFSVSLTQSLAQSSVQIADSLHSLVAPCQGSSTLQPCLVEFSV